MNTNWSTPSTNILAGILQLRNAIASGENAKLIRIWNEECQHPIKEKVVNSDFRSYEFSGGHMSTKKEILESNKDDFMRHLTLNYKTCFGTKESVEKYYSTGVLSMDNIKGMGVAHLVKVSDLIELLEKDGQQERANLFREQYLNDDFDVHKKVFWDFYRLKKGSLFSAKKFNKKVWAVAIFRGEKIKIPFIIKVLNFILYPLKYIPKRSILRMDNYTVYTLRVGGVTNGYSVQFQIPKKFNFK